MKQKISTALLQEPTTYQVKEEHTNLQTNRCLSQ